MQVMDDKNVASKIILSIEYKKTPAKVEAPERPPSPPKPEPGTKPAKVEAPVAEPPDLLVILGPRSLQKIIRDLFILLNLQIFSNVLFYCSQTR